MMNFGIENSGNDYIELTRDGHKHAVVAWRIAAVSNGAADGCRVEVRTSPDSTEYVTVSETYEEVKELLRGAGARVVTAEYAAKLRAWEAEQEAREAEEIDLTRVVRRRRPPRA